MMILRRAPTWVLVILVLASVFAEENATADDDAMMNDYVGDDDAFHWNNGADFGKVSVLPVSCINYNNGHMIKFDFYRSDEGHQCRFNNIGSFVVSIAHYMRAYFNQQALLNGNDFSLPGDAGYLNCVMLQETEYSETKLYAKIGCMDRQTFTSTKLQLHVYTDAQCSVPYDDGESSKRHSTRGYEINGYYFSTRVSFRPPFYTCEACSPEEISETFNKKNGNWYDDDYISAHGKKQGQNGNNQDDAYDDDYFNDDAYYYSNDDVAADDDARYHSNGNNDDGNGDDGGNGNGDDDGNGDDFKKDDDYYGAGDDYYGGRQLRTLKLLQAVPGQLEAYAEQFWNDLEQIKDGRSLYDNYYDIGKWNMCQRIYKYGVWCDDECQSLDAFRVDKWSHADVLLLVIMCVFMAAMMLLVVAKRLKAAQKASVYGDDSYKPGLPPFAMAMIFGLIMVIIIVLGKLKFVNETLVFAVVACILLFIYMLKLTLFENRRPVLLAAPRHDVFDNPLDDRLFD